MSITRREFLGLSATSAIAVLMGSSAFALTGCASSTSGTSASSSSFASSVALPTSSTLGQPASSLFSDLSGTTSDYSNPDNWMYYPESHTHDVDVIYLYPTVFSDPYGDIYAPLDAAAMRKPAQGEYSIQASAFEGLADIYVPYYRQFNSAYAGFYNAEALIEACHGLPRTDLYGALDYYFENANNGRPFILAGHSQGSIVLSMILREYFRAHADYLDHMVVTYQIGFSLTTDMLTDNPALKAATGADDTGVVVSWNTEGPGNADAGFSYVRRANAIAINPLNWATDGTYAGVDQNLGSVMEDASGNYSLQPGMADAQVNVDRGTVVTTTVDAATYAGKGVVALMFGPESYHSNDYGLYYANIRQNAAVRIQAYQASH